VVSGEVAGTGGDEDEEKQRLERRRAAIERENGK
jgi:hypothetical protein